MLTGSARRLVIPLNTGLVRSRLRAGLVESGDVINPRVIASWLFNAAWPIPPSLARENCSRAHNASRAVTIAMFVLRLGSHRRGTPLPGSEWADSLPARLRSRRAGRFHEDLGYPCWLTSAAICRRVRP